MIKYHLKTLVEDQLTGEIICACCGQVIEQKTFDFSNTHIERNPDTKHLPGRPVSRPEMHDNNLTTLINESNVDFRGQKISVDNQRLAHSFRREQIRVRETKEERVLKENLLEVAIVARRLGIPDNIKEDACYFIRKLYKSGWLNNKQRRFVACICLYLSSKRSTTPRNIKLFTSFLKDSAKNSHNAQHRHILISVKEVADLLNIETVPVNQSHLLIRKICLDLKIKLSISDLAIKFSDLYENEISSQGKTPQVKAGLAVYTALKLFQGRGHVKPSADDIADYLNVSFTAITITYGTIKDFLFVNKGSLMEGLKI